MLAATQTTAKRKRRPQCWNRRLGMTVRRVVLRHDFFTRHAATPKRPEPGKEEAGESPVLRNCCAGCRAAHFDTKPGGVKCGGGPPFPLFTTKARVFSPPTNPLLDREGVKSGEPFTRRGCETK